MGPSPAASASTAPAGRPGSGAEPNAKTTSATPTAPLRSARRGPAPTWNAASAARARGLGRWSSTGGRAGLVRASWGDAHHARRGGVGACAARGAPGQRGAAALGRVPAGDAASVAAFVARSRTPEHQRPVVVARDHHQPPAVGRAPRRADCRTWPGMATSPAGAAGAKPSAAHPAEQHAVARVVAAEDGRHRVLVAREEQVGAAVAVEVVGERRVHRRELCRRRQRPEREAAVGAVQRHAAGELARLEHRGAPQLVGREDVLDAARAERPVRREARAQRGMSRTRSSRPATG
jgi:hypothetical protein